MIGIDFRDRGTGEELEGFLKQVLERGKAFRMGILLIGALLAFVGVESLRLAGAMHNVRELEQRRDSLAFDVQRMQARVRAVRVRRTALLSAIERRRSNFDFARKIGAAGDMLATTMALTRLRVAPEGFDIEGRGTSLTDIRASLGRLESSFDKPATFELRRDDIAQDALSFHFGIATK